MSALPPDAPRLHAIMAFLDKQIADNETVGTYLRLQRNCRTSGHRACRGAAVEPSGAAAAQAGSPSRFRVVPSRPGLNRIRR
jgi:hypothetical protein